MSATIPPWPTSCTNAASCYRNCRNVDGAWTYDIDELMPSSITEHSDCVTGAAEHLRSYFVASWGGSGASLVTCTFYDTDRTTILKSQTVVKGSSATPPTPSRPHYVLSWDGNYTNLQSDSNVYLVAVPEVYTVTINYWDGGDQKQTRQQVEYLHTATFPSSYQRNECNFKEWSSPPDEPITSNVTIYAMYCPKPLCFTAETAGATVKFKKYGSSAVTASVRYSTDGVTWHSYNPNASSAQKITLQHIGDKVYFKNGDSKNTRFAHSLSAFGVDSYHSFETTGILSCSGHIHSMMDSETGVDGRFRLSGTTGYDYCNMFYGTGITSTPMIDYETVYDHSFYSMFYGCSEIETVNYSGTIVCAALDGMFCMFRGCTKITDMSSMTLTSGRNGGQNFYRMFYGCSHLTKAPAITAEKFMPSNCFKEMFKNCAELSEIEYDATTLDPTTHGDWLSGVAETGTFSCPNELIEKFIGGEYARGADTVPEGWNLVAV